MAIMIKVHKRGTDLKKNYRDDIKIATKRLRLCLITSLLLNLVMGCIIYKI